MSYARGNIAAPSISDESCTAEEKEQIATLPESTFTSFVSPAERKRRQLAKLESMKREQEHAKQPVVTAAVAATDAEVKIEEPLVVAVKDDPKDDDDDQSDSSDDESSSSDTTSKISNVNSSSPKSGGSNEGNAVDDVPDSNANTTSEANPPHEGTDSADEDISEIPLESDTQKRKRGAIQEVMRDTSLSQVEKHKKIQDIIAGKVDLGDVQITPPPQAPPEATPLLTATTVATITTDGVELETSVSDEHVSEIPLESDMQKRKRVAIQGVMRDSTLSQMEKNTKIQEIIRGKVDLGRIKLDEPKTPAEVPLDEMPVVETAFIPGGDPRSVETETQQTQETLAMEEAVTPALDNTEETKALIGATSYTTSVAAVETSHQHSSLEADGVELSVKEQPKATPADGTDDLDANYQRNIQRGLELKSQQQHRENQTFPKEHVDQSYEEEKTTTVASVASISYDRQFYEQKQKKLDMQLEQKRKEMEMQMEIQRRTLELEQQRQMREIELKQQLELEMARQRRLELEQQQREMEFQAEQRRLREEAENRRQAERHRLEMERMRDLERQQSMRQLQQERERRIQEELDQRRQVDMSRAVGNSVNHTSSLSAVEAAKTLMSRMNYFRPPRSNQPKSSRYDGVDDEELNWRLDCYASLSDFTIVVHRALPGPFAPDFDVGDINLIDVALGADGSPLVDVYYVHKVMLAVGAAWAPYSRC
jgi:hypothetical protein